MLSYLLKVTLCWAVFYLLYHLLLGKETFFRLNRWYLLGTVLLGLAIPAIEFELALAAEPQIFYLQPITIGVEQLETVIVSASGQEQGFDFWQMLVWVYWAGVVVASVRFGYGLFQILKLYRAGKISEGRGYRFVTTPAPHVPFSFFKNLFWSQKFEVDETDRQSIIRHEEAHIFQWHSLDVVLLELAGIFLWCSPLVYLYKKAIKTTHEYLADAYVTEGFSKKQYGRLLLRQSQPEGRLWQRQIAISNSLFSSQLKKRIVMMTKNKSSQQASLKYLAVLPALALLFLAFSFTQKNGASLTAPETAVVTDTLPEGEVFKVVEEMPRFPGCEEITDAAERTKCAQTKMLEFIFKNIKYPDEARKNGVEGMSVVKFIVEKDGSISEAEIARSIGSGCDEEVLKVVYLMPNWIPGKQRGRTVRTQFMLPVKFKLDAEAPKNENKATQAEETFKVVEQMPVFAGCATAEDKDACSKEKLFAFIIDNLKYPEAAQKTGVEGMVVIKFVVGKDGSVRNAEAVKSIGGGCDEEALRVVNAMPKWEPGIQRGRAVAVEMALPFKFALPKDEVKKAMDSPLQLFEVFPNPASGESFSVKFKTEPGKVSILFRDASGRDLIEKSIQDYDGSERTERISTKGLFENKTAKGTVFVSLLDGKGNILGSSTVVVQ